MANGYVRYGNSIHLDGFQILDFCIENAISLESLRDLNLGRKVFLTGNDTNAGYLRENVWDGTRWRAAAYLDDLTSFKDEDFQQLKEKVDTLIGDGVDMDGIIESWKEVEAFLKGMSDTKNLMTMLDGKLDKTGGTISNDKWANQLILNHSTSGEPAGLRFHSNNELMGIIYVNYQHRLMFHNGTISNLEVLHAGNVGDYALKTDGSNIMTTPIKFSAGSVDYDAVGDGLAVLHTSSANNAPNNYEYGRTLSVVNGSAGFQLGIASVYPTLYYRAKNRNSWSDWKTIAFTDSTVAAAYKLKNPSTNGDVVTITDEGNIEIAGANNVYTRKLAVGIGSAHIISTTTGVPALGTPAANSLLVGSVHYGLQIGTDTNSEASFIQAQRFDSADAKTLNLNPRGGAVNVGGNLAPNANNSLSLGTSSYRWSDVYSVEGNFSGYVRIANDYGLLSTTTSGSVVQMVGVTKNNALFVGTDACIVNKMLTSVYGSLINFYTGATLETRTKTMTLTSSGHVLIGGAEDDEETALQVTGLIKVYDSSSKNYVAKYSSTGVQFLLTSGKRNLVSKIDKDGKNIGALAFDSIPSDPNTLDYISFRDDTSIWFTINSTASSFNVATTFNKGALIPTGQKLTIGSVTFEEDAAGRVKVDGDMYTTGTLASGGKAKEGTGTGSGSANVRDFELPADGKTTYDCDHLLKSKNVIVQVFEKAIQNKIEVWEMILTDVTIVTEDRVTVTFGRPTTKVHKVHIIGGNVS